MQSDSGTLSSQEAAEILKIETSTLRQMVRRGLIRPIGKGAANRLRFELSEVVAASRIRNARVELHAISNVAHRALAMAEMTEQRVQDLYTLLGIGYSPLSVETDAVAGLFQEAEHLLELEDPMLSVSDVRSWASAFLAMTGSYLTLTEETIGKTDTWNVYVSLAEKLCEQAPRGLFNFHKDLETAYGFLEAGRRNVLSCSFFFVRDRHGLHTAMSLFPDRKKNLDEAILAFIPE